MESLTTEVWSLDFFIKGNRLCFITKTPQGGRKRHWVDLSDKVSNAIHKEVDAHIAHKLEVFRINPQQLAEYYRECGGS